MQTIKKIAGISFALAFLMALVLFTNISSGLISRPTARLLFMVFGAIGLVLNLFSFQSGKHSPVFNFSYWIGSIVLFTGLTFRLMHWPFSQIIILGGVIIMGISFFLPNRISREKNTDLLDEEF